MGPLGHFAVGLLCGTIIMIPFLKDRSLFDYDTQKWVSIEWIPYLHSEKKGHKTNLVTANNSQHESITDELNPLTKSKFLVFGPLTAILCGIIALLPDISHLWGNSNLDHSRYADLFFFHFTLDVQYVQNIFFVQYGYLFDILIFFTAFSVLLSLMAVSNDFQYNRHNYENCLV